MSSNIRIQKVCLHCHQPFIAKTTITRYCSHGCNRKHYKLLKREDKLQLQVAIVNANEKNRNNINIHRDYLSMIQAAMYIGVHERTIMKMIKDGRLKSHKVGRRVIISRDAITTMLNE